MATTGHESEAVNVAGMKASLQEYKSKFDTLVTMSEAPTASTLTYTHNNKTYPFKIGDEVRVPDAESASEGANGYVYYKLYDIQNGTAFWDLGGSGGSGGGALGKVKVYLKDVINSIEQVSPSFAGVVVTLQNTTDSGAQPVTKTIAAGETSCTFTKVTPQKNYSVSVSALDSQHTTPAAQTIANLGIGDERELTFLYEADEYTAQITSNQGASDEAVAAAWVRAQYTLDGQTVNSSNLTNGQTWKVPHGVTLSVSASSNVTHYSKQTDVDTTNKLLTAAYATTKVNLQMVGVVSGTEGAFPTGAAGTVKYSGGADQVLEDNTSLALVPTGTAFVIDYAAVASYGTPAQYSATAAGTAMTASKAAYTYGMLTINVTNNDEDDTDLAKVKVYITIGSGSEEEVTGTIANHVKTFQKAIVPGTQYSVRYDGVEGYDTPATVSGTMPAAGTETLSAQYNTERLSVSLSADEGAPNLTTVTITVKNASDDSVLTTATGSLTDYKIPYGVTYKVSLSDIGGYVTPSFNGGSARTASEATHSETLMYVYNPIKYAYVKIDQTQSGDTAMITVSDTEGGAALTCPTTSSATHPNAAMQALRDATHLFMGTFSNGTMTLHQLQDADGTKYLDGTTANFDGTEGDHWMRIGVEFYVKRVSGSDSGNQVTYGIAVGGQPDSTWKQIVSPQDLLAVHEAYISGTSLYSRSGVQSGASQTRDTFNQYARNRGTGFQIVTWEWHCVMALLFYAWYGRTNSQAQCGTGADSYARTLGTKDSLGMTDTTSSNGNADNTKFWGIENWWGNKYEWVDNVDVNNSVWTIKDINGNTKRTNLQACSSNGYIQKLMLSENLDLIPTGVGGSETTYFCDYYYQNTDSRVVARSRSGAGKNGGVACVNANFDSSYTYAYIGSRLAFSGSIEIA